MMRASMSNLVRTLGLRDIYLLTIGSVIGSGIFLVPATILMQVHLSVGLALLVWIAGGVLSLLGALTYGELGAMNPAAGGLYVYIRDAFGPLPAFLYGWALFLVIAPGTNAALAVAFSTYLGEIIPLSHLGAQLVGLTMLALITALNVLGTRKSADVQNWSTLVKMAGVVVMSGILFACGHEYSATRASMWPAHFDGGIAAGFGLAMIGVMWAYEGWQWVSYSAGEMINPTRDFPRASLGCGIDAHCDLPSSCVRILCRAGTGSVPPTRQELRRRLFLRLQGRGLRNFSRRLFWYRYSATRIARFSQCRAFFMRWQMTNYFSSNLRMYIRVITRRLWRLLRQEFGPLCWRGRVRSISCSRM